MPELGTIIGLLGLVALAIAPIALCIFVIYGARRNRRLEEAATAKWWSENGFNAFQDKYPRAVKDGRVTCPYCGGHGVFTRAFDYRINRHQCNVCGRTLYHSDSAE